MGSSLWHEDFLVAACMRDLVPQPGIEPRPPVLGAWSLTHWTTREVPWPDFLQGLQCSLNCTEELWMDEV